MDKLIDGKMVAAKLREAVAEEVAGLPGNQPKPGLAVILVGDDPASHVYVRNKGLACEKAGIRSEIIRHPADISEAALLAEVERINRDPDFHGLLVQLPLPGHIDEQKVIEAVNPLKDVDCFHPYNVGRLMIGMQVFEPATPAGMVQLLKHYEIPTKGRHLVMVGRSNIVGKPMANLMLQKAPYGNAIVTVAHSAAPDLAAITRQADILVAAIGRPHFIGPDMVKEGAVVLDVGTNRIDADNAKGYRLVGDVDFEAVLPKVSHITPVPGGVGPMTIAMLLRNTMTAYRLQVG
ncbi:MAG TPA: bifunctional methylenetetrahydrofolate dehydrogenase/methenyltetrahydrofolate cyclohydrolase FolD [Calditrichia bacterium]|nr:bifunctional methylenetetrahydrofolate dehydrogenase/methenyltetrahydrofolate cyclohydrolase FolD [Calditrichia bacterium]HQV33924.1 bifunctional methylenetetrahydrofolate dehydrogenase/methenyltetrahydrofolate cyclohydrolase FolD [Calditrichia bacterium]